MTLLAIALSHAGLVALCLAMEKHHVERFGRARTTRSRRHALRWLGWVVIGAALACCVAAHGGVLGPLYWLGALTLAGLVLSLGLLPYRPRLAMPLAVAAPPLAGLGALLAAI